MGYRSLWCLMGALCGFVDAVRLYFLVKELGFSVLGVIGYVENRFSFVILEVVLFFFLCSLFSFG